MKAALMYTINHLVSFSCSNINLYLISFIDVNLSLNEVTSSSIQLTLFAIPEAVTYQLEVTDASNTTMVFEISPDDFIEGLLSYTVDGLNTSTAYTVNLKYTDAGGEEVMAGSLSAVTNGKLPSVDVAGNISVYFYLIVKGFQN